jgi:EmrB/QacA subfamily drug resistance transporter
MSAHEGRRAQAATRRARLATSPRYRWTVLTASLLGLFSAGFSITVLAVSVNTIAEDLSTSRNLMTWVVTGPILAYAVFGPSAGKLADILGARRVYLVSISIVVVFAALSAVAWSGGSLIAFRVLGAAFGAAVGPSSLSMINRLFPPDERSKALGFWAMVAAGGPVIGVIIGGPVVEAWSWRWIFIGQVPITLAALAFGWAVLPDVPRRLGVRFDVVGSAVLAVGASGLLVGLNRAPEMGWTHPFVLVCVGVVPIAAWAFVRVERRVTDPLLPLGYVRRPDFSFAIANQFFLNFAYMGGFIITPLMLQDVLGWGEAKTGFVSIARPLVFTIAGPIAGYLTVRVGLRINGVVGGVAIVASMLGLAAVGAGTSTLFIVAVLGLSGLGQGTATPAMATAIANAVDEQDLGVATAFQQMCAQIGTVFGTQVLLTVQAAMLPGGATPGELAASYHWAYLAGAVGALAGVVSALFVSGRPSRAVRSARASADEVEAVDEIVAASARP